MAEYEFALDTIDFLAVEMRRAAAILKDRPEVGGLVVFREGEAIGRIMRDDQFLEDVRFVPNEDYFSVYENEVE